VTELARTLTLDFSKQVVGCLLVDGCILSAAWFLTCIS
jgi:hypothetical protein